MENFIKDLKNEDETDKNDLQYEGEESDLDSSMIFSCGFKS
jgi:hypothetical protein